jgi:hypothetical protein
MPKLSDTQLMLLSSATQRDGLVVLPAKLRVCDFFAVASIFLLKVGRSVDSIARVIRMGRI